MTELRDQLKAGLSASANASEDKAGPSAADLADRIKALKASNTVEASPQRAPRRATAAEEPVTARIRRRQEQAEAGANAVDDADELAGDKNMGFAQRILAERLRNPNGEGHGPG